MKIILLGLTTAYAADKLITAIVSNTILSRTICYFRNIADHIESQSTTRALHEDDEMVSGQRNKECAIIQHQLSSWNRIQSAVPFARLYQSNSRYWEGSQYARLTTGRFVEHKAAKIERYAVCDYFTEVALSFGREPYWNQISPDKARQGKVGQKLTIWPKDLRSLSKHDVFDANKHVYCIIDNSYLDLPATLLTLPDHAMVFIYDYQYRCQGNLDNNGSYYVCDDEVITTLTGSPGPSYKEKAWMLEGDAINVFGPSQHFDDWFAGPCMYANALSETVFGFTILPHYSFIFKRYRVHKRLQGLAPGRSMRFLLPICRPLVGPAALSLSERGGSEALRRTVFADPEAPGYNRTTWCNEDYMCNKDTKDKFRLSNRQAVTWHNVQRNGMPISCNVPDGLFGSILSYAFCRHRNKSCPVISTIKQMIEIYFENELPKHRINDAERLSMANIMADYAKANSGEAYRNVDFTRYSRNYLSIRDAPVDGIQDVYTYCQKVPFWDKYGDLKMWRSMLKSWNTPVLEQLPSCPSRTRQNDLAAALFRIVMTQFEVKTGNAILHSKDIHLNHPKFPGDLRRLMIALPDLLVGEGHGKLTPASLDDIFEWQSSTVRRRRFVDGTDEPYSFLRPALAKTGLRTLFVKGESYNESGKHPRCITPADDNEVLCIFSKFVLPFVKSHMSNKDWYGFGKTPCEIANHVAKICSTRGVNSVNLGDLSRCDGRTCSAIYQLEYFCLLRAYDVKYHHEISSLFFNEIFRTARVAGYRLPTLSARPSGYPDTSMGNTLKVLLICTLTTMRHYKIGTREAYERFERHCIIGGDDALMANVPAADFTDAAASLGDVAKSTIVAKGSYGVEFLGRQFLETVWWGNPTSHADVNRQLLKLHLGWKPHVGSPEYYGFLKCRAYHTTDARTPILGPYTRNYIIAYLGLFNHPFVKNLESEGKICEPSENLYQILEHSTVLGPDVGRITLGSDQIRAPYFVTHWDQFVFDVQWPQQPFTLNDERLPRGFDRGNFNFTLEHCYNESRKVHDVLQRQGITDFTSEMREKMAAPFLEFAFSSPANAYALLPEAPICDFHSSHMGFVKGMYSSLGTVEFGTNSTISDLEFRETGQVNTRRWGAPRGIRVPPALNVHKLLFGTGVTEVFTRRKPIAEKKSMSQTDTGSQRSDPTGSSDEEIYLEDQAPTAKAVEAMRRRDMSRKKLKASSSQKNRRRGGPSPTGSARA